MPEQGFDDTAELRPSIEELQAENERLRMRLRRAECDVSYRRRSVASSVLVALATMCVLIAVPLVWFSSTLLESERYVETVAPLAEDPAIREAAADVVADEVLARVDVGPALRSTLPEAFHGVVPAIEQAFDGFVADLSSGSIESEAFSDLWISGNRQLHRAIVTEYFSWTRDVGWGSVLAAAILFVAAMLVSPHRLATTAWGAFTVTLGSAASGAFLMMLRRGSGVVAATAAGQQALEAMFAAVTGTLLVTLWTVAGIALLVTIVALFMLGRRRRVT